MTLSLRPPAPRTIFAPKGRGTLPIVELLKTDVEKPRKRVRLKHDSKKWKDAQCSFGNFCGELSFNAWAFFHAAKKTMLASTFTSRRLNAMAMDFADDHRDLFVWNNANLRRANRSVFDVEDFESGRLGGRFGEAIAYLFMMKQGYTYWDRIGTLWERAAKKSIDHKEMTRRARVIAARMKLGRPDLEPDFAFENLKGAVALAEAKGSFVHPDRDDPSAKEDLRHALKQLAEWSKWITPTPTKSYGIGTYFRDESDVGKDPSLVTYVDPPNQSDPDASPVELPEDWIRRGNYGAWLIGMGLMAAGEALRNATAYDVSATSMLVVAFGNRRFAVIPYGFISKDYSHPSPPWSNIPFWLTPLDLRRMPSDFISLELGIQGVLAMGIEVTVMRHIERALAAPDRQVLLGIESEIDTDNIPPTQGPPVSLTEAEGFDGSIMPDGTLFGLLTPRDIADATEERFVL